jgi:tetratricopeptide (TPR) repeat protein
MPTLARKIFLSSTFIDLENYREAAVHACRRVGLIPIYMEDFPPDPRDAIAFCKAKVEEADLFLGIYAHRYGYVPDGSKVSITEMEYAWAVERKLPVHLFVIDPDYPWLPSKVDKGRDFKRLESFKRKIGKDHTLKKFRDVETFKEDVLLLGHDLARPDLTSSPEKPVPARRYLPAPPEMHSVPSYIQSSRFIGRRKELVDLDAWAGSPDPVLVIEAIGGVGKSALTWEWVRDGATKAIPGLAGVLWWSFYEGGASTASFVREALAYVTQVDPEELRAVPQDEQVPRLLTELRRHPYLLVLDGFERLLTAYHQLDPSKLKDDQVKTDHRACTSIRTDQLLQQLVACSPSKCLITSRLMPSALENRAHQPLPGIRHLKLSGLDPADGENLLKSLGVHGDSAAIRRFLKQFDNHSLLIGVLAGQIAKYRPAPGDFDRWRADPREGGRLRLSRLDLKQRRTHILAYAFEGLDPQKRQLLSRISALSDAADYETISILNPYLSPAPEKVEKPDTSYLDFVRMEMKKVAQQPTMHKYLKRRESEAQEEYNQKMEAYGLYQRSLTEYLESSERRAAISAFDTALSDLEDRGLLQWDQHSNQYDLHPVVRGYAFDQLEESDREYTFGRIRNHFESLPSEDFEAATELSGLRNTIQIYRALIGSSQLDLAASFFNTRLTKSLLFSVASYPTVVELLNPMFHSGTGHPPTLSKVDDQIYIISALDVALHRTGKDSEASKLIITRIELGLKSENLEAITIGLNNYSTYFWSLGHLAASFRTLELAYQVNKVSKDRDDLTALYLREMEYASETGQWKQAYEFYKKFTSRPTPPWGLYRVGSVESSLCLLKFWQGTLGDQELRQALGIATQANNLWAQKQIQELRAEVALRKGKLNEAVEAIDLALEIGSKTGIPDARPKRSLARVLALQGRHDEAREMVEEAGLENSWQSAEVYLEIGDLEKARESALGAYKKAWADGPPYIFWWDLENSKRILARLGVPEPELPPFDPSKLEPIPFEAEIRTVLKKLKAGKTKKDL